MAENEHRTILKLVVNDSTPVDTSLWYAFTDKINELVASVNKLNTRLKNVESDQEGPKKD